MSAPDRRYRCTLIEPDHTGGSSRDVHMVIERGCTQAAFDDALLAIRQAIEDDPDLAPEEDWTIEIEEVRR